MVLQELAGIGFGLAEARENLLGAVALLRLFVKVAFGLLEQVYLLSRGQDLNLLL